MKQDDKTLSMVHTVPDTLLHADADSLRAALSEIGVDPIELINRGRAAIDRAISSVDETRKLPNAGDQHEGLCIFLRLLRRRDNLSEEQLAERARVDVAEIRRIEYDRTYTPLPRTIYQLEQVFNLPRRSLVRLSGLTRQESPDFTKEVLRFAASAKNIERLTRDERKILNAFVHFLSAAAASEDE